MTAKHKHARNPLRWVPVLTLLGLAFAGGVSVSAYSTLSHNTPHHALSPPVSAPASIAVAKPPPEVKAPQIAVQPLTYTVRKNDSMWSIARAHCGTGTKDTALAKANHITSWVISPGQVITIIC